MATVLIQIENVDAIVLSEVASFNKNPIPLHARTLIITDKSGNGVEVMLSSADLVLLQSLIKGAV